MVQSAFMTDRGKGGWAGGEETEREDRAGGGGGEAGKTQNRVFKWVYRKASWHWNRHAPSHNGRDINFSALCFPLCHHSFSPSLSSFSPSALTLHLASSLSLTPFPPFYSFSLLSHHFFLLTLPDLTLVLFLSLLFCRWIVLFLLCVFLNLSLLPTAFASLLLEPFTSAFPPSSSVRFFF